MAECCCVKTGAGEQWLLRWCWYLQLAWVASNSSSRRLEGLAPRCQVLCQAVWVVGRGELVLVFFAGLQRSCWKLVKAGFLRIAPERGDGYILYKYFLLCACWKCQLTVTENSLTAQASTKRSRPVSWRKDVCRHLYVYIQFFYSCFMLLRLIRPVQLKG